MRFLKKLEEEQWEACLSLDGQAASAYEKYLIWDAFLGFYPLKAVTGSGEHDLGSFRREALSAARSCINPDHDLAAAGFRLLSFNLWNAEERERDQRRRLEEERSELWVSDLPMSFQA